MKTFGIGFMVVAGCICILAAVMTSCETSSTPASPLSISPSAALVSVNSGTNVINETVTNSDGTVTTNATLTGSATFTAIGGSGVYTWSLTDPSLGSISASGQTAVYTPSMITGQNTLIVASGGYTASSSITQR